ncbi:MAG: DUF2865 domain-containing protein [Bradyrhizobium sp.]|nr:DUF2865 domain-containing protein [Bradyrhizobium sp.]
MPETLNLFASSRILAGAALLGSLLASSAASAQMQPGIQPPPPAGPAPQGAPPAVNPICPRLEAQLATIDRGGSGDPQRDDQIRRYQDAQTQQQAELDRVTMQAKRMGCDSSGFFSLFSGQSSQCGPVNTRIQQMRANLDQITSNLERLRTGGFGGADRDNQRRSVLVALAQNNCGPQYANAAAALGPGGFLNNLFGGGNSNPGMSPGADPSTMSGAYRTVCVRTCDGGYFPISFSTSPARFADDERSCKALCPAAEAELYAYRNPGEDINQAVSVNGQPYTALPNAFKFRTEFNPSCACKAPGQTWQDALKSIDDKAEAAQQGDIIVTEESARKMQQRAQQQPPAKPAKKGAPPTQATAPASDDSAAPAADASTSGTAANRPIRTVGPRFLQENSTPSVPR